MLVKTALSFRNPARRGEGEEPFLNKERRTKALIAGGLSIGALGIGSALHQHGKRQGYREMLTDLRKLKKIQKVLKKNADAPFVEDDTDYRYSRPVTTHGRGPVRSTFSRTVEGNIGVSNPAAVERALQKARDQGASKDVLDEISRVDARERAYNYLSDSVHSI